MRSCYHQNCDYPDNPDIKPESLYFLAKATQAIVLAVADLTNGLGKCDLSNFDMQEQTTSPPPSEHSVLSEDAEEAPAPESSGPAQEHATGQEGSAEQQGGINEYYWSALIDSILKQKVRESESRPPPGPSSSWPPRPPTSDRVHQPNYGNQFNIEHLTVNFASQAQVGFDSHLAGDEESREQPVGALVLPPGGRSDANMSLDKVAQILSKVFHSKNSELEKKKKLLKNSPMLIKVL